MSVDVSKAVWKHSRQTGTHLLFLLALADNANDDGWAWPNAKKLAKKVRVESRQYRNIRQHLIDAGELIFVEGRGRGHLSRYGIPLYPEELDYAPVACHEAHQCNGKHTPMSDPDTTPGYRAYHKKGQSDTPNNSPETEKGQGDTSFNEENAEKGQSGARKGAIHNRGNAEKGQSGARKGAIQRHEKCPEPGNDKARREMNVIVTHTEVTSEETARTREPLSREKNESMQTQTENQTPDPEPPLVPRRPPYSDPAFRRWALSQTGGWMNLSGKRLGMMMDQYCEAKGIPL